MNTSVKGPPIEGYGLRDTDVAKFAGLNVWTVRRWRVEGRGPRFRRVGGSIRYSMADLLAWWDSLPAGGAGAR
jgi:hypothetical protein